jgi:hypothetical protein
MLRRGCAIIVVTFAAIFAIYLAALSRYVEWPGNLIAAAVGALFGAMGIGGVSHLFHARRDTRAFARAARHEAPAHGALAVAAGPMRPLGAPLTSPLGGHPCVAYEYEVKPQEVAVAGRRQSGPSRCDIAGFAMTAAVIETPYGGVRMLGFPLLDEFPQAREGGGAAQARAASYLAATPFEVARGTGALTLFAGLDDALGDADGIVRKDFRLTSGDIPFEQRMLRERIVRVGEPVCALGRYDAEKRALVPAGATPNRLWPGKPEEVRRRIVSAARSQATVGLVFVAVSHAMLAGGLYLSETRYARVSEADQASAIRIAVQDHDVAALERVVRQGANPNARDVFGDPVLLDVREAELASALIRLGADVDVRHREDNDTPLIRAARMGLTPLVRVLLDARADVHAEMTDGATALSEARRGGHDEVVSMLLAAGAGAPAAPVERPR